MSKETAKWLNTMTVIGCTDKRGTAWHHRADLQTPWSVTLDDGRVLTGIGNHYPGFIPVEHVTARLFNWEPLTGPVFAIVGILPDGTPEYAEIPNTKRVYPSDVPTDTFWIAKDSYAPHPYDDTLIGGISDIVDTSRGELGISSAGLLKNRGTAWVEISIPDSITTPEGVEFRPNLLAATSLNGTLATVYTRTLTAVVCDNTLTMALSEKGQSVRVRHSKYSSLRLADAREALKIIHETADGIEEELAQLCSIEVTNAQFFDIVKEMTTPDDVKKGKEPTKNALTLQEKKTEQLAQLWNNDNRVSPWAGTGFGVMQAFNTWEQHFKRTRGGTSVAERNMLATINGDIEKSDREVYATMTKVLSNA